MKIIDHLKRHNNDYTGLEEGYRHVGMGELVRDPFGSIKFRLEDPTLSATVVIPCWNSADTILLCLKALETCSFNQRFPEKFEVVVVDDGSDDDTWGKLLDSSFNMNHQIIRQHHFSRPHAVNVGISQASGDILISCDSDMLLSPYTIEEFMKRHEFTNQALFIGFRSDIEKDELPTELEDIANWVAGRVPSFWRDNRFDYDFNKLWPNNMFLETDGFKGIGRNKSIWVSCDNHLTSNSWTLERMVYGALFSVPRRFYLDTDAYDENFFGWGWEDTSIGAKAIACGYPQVPVPSAFGFHIAHGDSTPNKWQEADANRKTLIENVFSLDLERFDKRFLRNAPSRIREQVGRQHNGKNLSDQNDLHQVFETVGRFLEDANNSILYNFSLGEFELVVQEENELDVLSIDSTTAYIWSLIYTVDAQQALSAIEVASSSNNEPFQFSLEEGFAHLLSGNVDKARAIGQMLSQRQEASRIDRIRHYLQYSVDEFVGRAQLFRNQGSHSLAFRDYAAAIMKGSSEHEVLESLKQCSNEMKRSTRHSIF